MPVIDIILLIFLGGFVLFGLWFGFIHTLGSLVGVVVGSYLAGQYYEPFGSYLTSVFDFANLAKIAAFIIIFIIANRLVGFVFWIINKMFNIISIIPFLKSINRLLGALLGFVEGSLVLGLILYILGRYSVSSSLDIALSGSKVAHYLVKEAGILEPLLPEFLRQLESVI